MNEEIPTSTDSQDADPEGQANEIFSEVNQKIYDALQSINIRTGDSELEVRSSHQGVVLSTNQTSR